MGRKPSECGVLETRQKVFKQVRELSVSDAAKKSNLLRTKDLQS